MKRNAGKDKQWSNNADSIEDAQDAEIQELTAFELKDFLKLELPPQELILSPWLPTAGLAMIHAKPGVGKTYLSLNIAYAIATGGSFLGWKAERPHGVLFIDGEMYPASLQERLAMIDKSNGGVQLQKKFSIISANLEQFGIPDLATEHGREAINRKITDDISVIVLDNLGSLIASGKENDSESWQPLQRWLLWLRGKGKSVVMVHHSSKAGDQRGTSKRIDILNSSIRLERPRDYTQQEGARFIVRYEKARNFMGQDASPFEARLEVDSDGNAKWSKMSLEESTFQKIVTLANEGLNQKEISEELGVHKSTVSKHIKKAKSDGLIIDKKE